MEDDFIDDSVFEAKRLEYEKKKQKKQEKQQRLELKKQVLSELQNLLHKQNQTDSDDFESCYQASLAFKPGTKNWARAIMNLSENIELLEIRKKYIKLAQYWHPDKNNDTDNEAMKYLNEAWQILKKEC
ncbi:J domain-containing protein [Silvanigrella aquatica]|uniref:J domain-containing protein n=1 Tax=Silvanigrella aquatica TaxID=1915309 RepID=A0A1L4D1G8_9BACT|nr:J domain-containing protein [Silvanigrella aquatica]APJ04036.1 hypothetical protein AXG55_08995 [Silvanigrella aquatica]